MFPVICRGWARERGISAFERHPICMSTVQKNQAVSNCGVYNRCWTGRGQSELCEAQWMNVIEFINQDMMQKREQFCVM